MTQFEKLTKKLCRVEGVNCMEVAVIIAVVAFMQQMFHQGGNKMIRKFEARFGKHAYNRFQVLMGQRRN